MTALLNCSPFFGYFFFSLNNLQFSRERNGKVGVEGESRSLLKPEL